ncbi:hypothetical protein C8J57DRAFT_1653110 [Mycena rebaudengoi]|nr:hypothetical protein C8J57DRAFT_1653110 [Mycena rebaudengoi]
MLQIPALASETLGHSVFKASEPSVSHEPVTLTTIPTDILHIIILCLRDIPIEPPGWCDSTYEFCNGARLIPLSATCRYMRHQTMPWIFREVYNWSRTDSDVWPQNLWQFFVELHLRDYAVRLDLPITLSDGTLGALRMMPALNKVTLRMETPISIAILHAVALAPNLTSLEIHQARLDGSPAPFELPFSSLESLMICISGFQGPRAGARDILVNREVEADNMVTLLRAVNMISQMPALRELSVLFVRRDVGQPRPLGTFAGQPLSATCPHLNSVTLPNIEPTDPIFAQLPVFLDALHLMGARDQFYQPPPFTDTGALIVVSHIARLVDLVDLSLTLNHFPTPRLVAAIASSLPRLQRLQLGHASPRGQVRDVRDEALAETLARLKYLTDLRISLDLTWRGEREREDVAIWFLTRLPLLRTVSFCIERWLDRSRPPSFEALKEEIAAKARPQADAALGRGRGGGPVSPMDESSATVGEDEDEEDSDDSNDDSDDDYNPDRDWTPRARDSDLTEMDKLKLQLILESIAREHGVDIFRQTDNLTAERMRNVVWEDWERPRPPPEADGRLTNYDIDMWFHNGYPMFGG